MRDGNGARNARGNDFLTSGADVEPRLPRAPEKKASAQRAIFHRKNGRTALEVALEDKQKSLDDGSRTNAPSFS